MSFIKDIASAYCYAIAHDLRNTYANLDHICIDEATDAALLPLRFNATLRRATRECIKCSRPSYKDKYCQPLFVLEQDLHRVAADGRCQHQLDEVEEVEEVEESLEDENAFEPNASFRNRAQSMQGRWAEELENYHLPN
jgi:hypothetical protein